MKRRLIWLGILIAWITVTVLGSLLIGAYLGAFWQEMWTVPAVLGGIIIGMKAVS